jgi:UDP-hydrolysing UDP-N-acetyl-D-glucosamine 2-epimerase
MTRRIAVVTGSRADYGLLRPVLDGMGEHPNLELQLIVTGSHLSGHHDHTLDAILADGYLPAWRVDLALEGDTSDAVTRALGRGVIGFADALAVLQPDLLLVLGDRYEILAAAQAALIARIPVAHIAGGDVTEGAFDDAIRHAVTKLSHLHLVTHEAARRRVVQLGEQPERVFVTGSPGVDQILRTERLSRADLEQALDTRLRWRNLAITFHPQTLGGDDPLSQLEALLQTLDSLGPDYGLFFTGANADPRGETLNRHVAEYVRTRSNASLNESLGQQRYYSLVALADAVVGNSSSGLYEAPSLGTPTVNIGDRQAGRPRGNSVIDCPAHPEAIASAIRRALSLVCAGFENPYGDGRAARRILAVLAHPWDPVELVRKRFYDLAST